MIKAIALSQDTEDYMNHEDPSYAVSKSLVEFFGLLGMKKLHLSNGDSFYHLDTGLPDPLFNLICLPTISNIESIAEANKLFSNRNEPFCWLLQEEQVKKEILQHFQNDQYKFLGSFSGMELELANYQNSTTSQIPSIEIKQITSKKDFKEWAIIVAKVFGLSREFEDTIIEILSPDVIVVAAYSNGKMVATACAFVSDNIAGFYNGATLEEFRNKGISSALYHFRLSILKKMGIKKAVIQTSPMSKSIAQKVGFKPVTNYSFYLHI